MGDSTSEEDVPAGEGAIEGEAGQLLEGIKGV